MLTLFYIHAAFIIWTFLRIGDHIHKNHASFESKMLTTADGCSMLREGRKLVFQAKSVVRVLLNPPVRLVDTTP